MIVDVCFFFAVLAIAAGILWAASDAVRIIEAQIQRAKKASS